MIRFVDFKNFKGLRDARLPLSRFTLIVGPNGSGKSSAMQAISMATRPYQFNFWRVANADLQYANSGAVTITINWALDHHSLDSSRKKINTPRVGRPLPSELSVNIN